MKPSFSISAAPVLIVFCSNTRPVYFSLESSLSIAPGYDVGPDGELTVNPNEAKIVCWIFERYLAGDSLGEIAAGLERHSVSCSC